MENTIVFLVSDAPHIHATNSAFVLVHSLSISKCTNKQNNNLLINKIKNKNKMHGFTTTAYNLLHLNICTS